MADKEIKSIMGFDGNNYIIKDASALSSVILSTTSGTSSATLSIINRGGSTVSNIKMPFVRTDATTSLNSDVTTTWIRYARRKLTITGNDLTLDMTAESGGWAGTFLGFRDMSGKDASGNHTAKGLTAFGFYGGGDLGKGTLNYFFLGGSYSNSIAKLFPSDTSWGTVGRFEILKAADIIPLANLTYNLGTLSKKWKLVNTGTLSASVVVTSTLSADTASITNASISKINEISVSSFSINTHTHSITVSGSHKHNIPSISGGTHAHPFSIASSTTNHSHSINDPGHTHSISGTAAHSHSYNYISYSYDNTTETECLVLFLTTTSVTNLATATISATIGSKTTGITVSASSFSIANASTGNNTITISNVSTADTTITLDGTTSNPS